MLLKTSQMKDFVILIMTLNIICLLLVFTSVLSDSLRNCSRKWENKSTRDLFTDRQKRYCTGLHFNGFPSVPPSLHGIDQRWLDIEKSYRWNYIHLNSLGANRFSIVLFIVLRNTGLRLRESFVDFSFLKGKQWKKIDCNISIHSKWVHQYLFRDQEWVQILSTVFGSCWYCGEPTRNYREKVVEPKLGYTRTWSQYPIVVSYHCVSVWMFPLWMCL